MQKMSGKQKKDRKKVSSHALSDSDDTETVPTGATQLGPTGSVEPNDRQVGEATGQHSDPGGRTENPEDGFIEFWGLQMTRSQQRDFQLRLQDMLKPPAAGNGSQASECGGATPSVADEREEGECEMEPPLSYLGSLMRDLKKTVDLGPAVSEQLAANMKTLLTEELHVLVLEELKTKFPRPENMLELVVLSLNVELTKVITKEHKENDKVLKWAQDYLVLVAAVVLGNLDLLESGDADIAGVSNTLTDSLALLAKAMAEITRARREVLKKDVRHEFKEILDAAKNRPGGEFLIGKDLAKKLEDVRQAQKMVDTQTGERRCKQPFLPSRTGPHGYQGPPLCGGRSSGFTTYGSGARGRLQNCRAQGFQPRGAH